MKKCFSLILIILLLLTSVNISATEISSIDIMTNGNLEGDSSGWDSGGKVGFGLSRDYSRSPLYSYKVTYDPELTPRALTVRYFDAIPGATYEFSAWAYIASALPKDSVPGFSVTFMDDTSTVVGKDFSYKYTDITPGQWCHGSASGVAPEGATKVRVMLRLFNQSNTTENAVCYFDDTSFVVSGSGDVITNYIQELEYQKQLAKESQDSYDAQIAEIEATEFADGDDIEMVNDGDFDTIAPGTTLGTSASDTSFRIGKNASASFVNISADGIPANGSSVNALKINNTEAGKPPEVMTNTFNLEAGKVYKLSFDFLGVKQPGIGYAAKCYVGSGLQKISWSADGSTWSESWQSYAAYTNSGSFVTNSWHHHEVYFKHTTDFTNASILFYPHNTISDDTEAGVVWYIDNVSVTTKAEVKNLIPNPGFENGTDYKPDSWGAYSQGVWGTSLIRTDETAYSGSYSIKIDTTADGAQKGVSQTIFSGFQPGRKYLFQAKVKVKSYTRGYGASLKVIPLASTGGGLYNYLDGANSGNFIWEYEDPNGENWHDLKCVVDLPEETACVVIYLVVQGKCEIYFDDVKFALAKGENRFELFPERTFFYIDNEYGSVFADFNSAFDIAEGSTVEFTLNDGDTVLDSAILPATEVTKWDFNLNKMPDMLTKYTVKATYKDPYGMQIGQTLSENVYKTTRPHCLDRDGNYIDENGEYFYPLIGYGGASGFKTAGYAERAEEKLKELKDNHETNGINVYAMPMYGTDWSKGSEYALEKMRRLLDEAQEKGYKYFYTLGSGVPSAYPNGTYERTELILQNFANHPAIFAWSVMDEVSLKIKNDGTFKTYDYIKEWLEKSYIQIRKYDQSKPIYVLDTGRQEYMEKTSRMSDIFANDPYPASRADTVMQTYTKTKWSTGGTNGTTPVAIIAQMTPHLNGWRPTITEVRHQFYQAFWAGAKMVGFFSITGASDMTEELFTDYEGREEDWINFATNEKDLMYEHFTTDKTLLITNNQEGNVWYRMWRASDNNIYLTVMNMKHGGKNADANTVTAEINLVSDNGKLSIDGYTAELINGDETTLITSDSDDNVFSATLPMTTVAFYKITPKTELDFSLVEENAPVTPEEITLDIKCDGESIDAKTVTYGDASFMLSAVTNGSENPVWSVESGDCVSVNEFSGEVTIKKGGTAVIKAAVSSAYDTIEITINKKEITAVTPVRQGITEREYNGTKSVDTWVSPPKFILTGALDGDDVTIGGKYEFDSSAEGSNKPISLSDIVLTGANAEGYVLADSIPLYINNIGIGTITAYQGFDPDIPVVIELLSKASDTKYSYSFYTNSDLNYESIVYVAYYDAHDKLLGINPTSLSLVSYDSVVLDIDLNPLYPTAEKIKLFVWSDTMKPLATTYLSQLS